MLVAVLMLALQPGDWTLPAARPCTSAEVRELTAQPDAADTPFRLTCRAHLDGAAVTRRILIEGAEASGAGLDCGGGAIGRPGARTTTQAPTIAIWSRRLEGERPAWSRPTDVTISNYTETSDLRYLAAEIEQIAAWIEAQRQVAAAGNVVRLAAAS